MTTPKEIDQEKLLKLIEDYDAGEIQSETDFRYIVDAARSYREAKNDLAEANNLIEHLTDMVQKKGRELQLVRSQMEPLVSAMGIAIPLAIKQASKKGLQAHKDQLLRAEILLRAISQEPQGKA